MNSDDNKFDLNGRDPDSKPFEKQANLEAQAIQEKKIVKIELIKRVRALSEGEWLVTQEIMQDILAGLIVANPGGKRLPTIKLIELLKKEIERRHEDEPEMKDLLINSIPHRKNVDKWFKAEHWEEAVWIKVRGNELFNNNRRSAVIESLYKRAVEGSDVAAKIWLTLSGDYSDKMDIHTDKRIETYREINKVLLNKKTD